MTNNEWNEEHTIGAIMIVSALLSSINCWFWFDDLSAGLTLFFTEMFLWSLWAAR